MSGDAFFGALLGALFGGVVTLVLTIWFERLRSPRVTLSIIDPYLEMRPHGPFQRTWRSLRINVSNEPLSHSVNWWMLRLPAQQCRGEVSFHRVDGTPFFERPMVGRWAAGGSPEPRVVHLQTAEGTQRFVANADQLTTTVDIYPGDTEPLDIAIRVDQELDAYAWNNDTYFYENWRNPTRQLNHENYLIKVTISSSGRKCTGWFRIDNDGPFNGFRLSELTADQRQVVLGS